MKRIFCHRPAVDGRIDPWLRVLRLSSCLSRLPMTTYGYSPMLPQMEEL